LTSGSQLPDVGLIGYGDYFPQGGVMRDSWAIILCGLHPNMKGTVEVK